MARGRGRGHFQYGGAGGSRDRSWQEKNSGRTRGGRGSSEGMHSSQEQHKNRISGACSSSMEGGTKSKDKMDEMRKYQQGKQDMEMTDAARNDEAEGGDVRTGIKCARCTKKGHLAANCTTEIYCVICDRKDHVNFRCPVLKMPRPVAHAVGYAVHGLGFYHIPHPPLPRARKDTKMALISIEGGQLDKEEVQRQLARIFPGKWQWELSEHEDNSFITKFPSKIELQRAIAFGGADAKGVDIPAVRIRFDMWHEKETGYLLPKVWVRVYGIRKELREFQELWTVGSMLGSTQIVDMETTRKSDFGRIFVAVLNPKLIPASLDVVVGDHYFELGFEVEKIGVDETGKMQFLSGVGKRMVKERERRVTRSFLPEKKSSRERPRDTNTLVLLVDRRGRLQVQRLASMQMT
ncbi:hypothetical protein PVAP13_5KG483000 [Panicum virgatum]|uniref:CCHC-type domain-containing protein n=1 Tax=Panicum virgatum TaxID=38727 RepID=A0A8T0SV56_PANVG|nr:hypothetical protein PVAP13_5KG483000 [Panicum virgatum]